MLGVFAEFERAIIQERIQAGLARARREGHEERQADRGRARIEPREKRHPHSAGERQGRSQDRARVRHR
jgi:DNA invertase Pin-like site-specific DNA recombinase